MINSRYINSLIRNVIDYDGHKIQETYTFYTGELEYVEGKYFGSIEMSVESLNDNEEIEDFFVKSEKFELTLHEMDNLDKIINLMLLEYSEDDIENLLNLDSSTYSDMINNGYNLISFELKQDLVCPALKLWRSNNNDEDLPLR